MMLVAPIAHLAEIDRDVLNRCLVLWEHKMRPWERPSHGEWLHALFQNGEPIAVTAAGYLIRETCAGFTRAEAIELGRLCASRSGLNRLMLRAWREFVFSALCRHHGWRWAVSYQDAVLHSGATYRFDGWVRLGTSSSGNDYRSGRKGRRKVIWGWCDDAAERHARAAA